MGYQYLPKDKILFNFGDTGTAFYIIIKGEVNVRIPSEICITMKVCEYEAFMDANKGFITEEDDSN